MNKKLAVTLLFNFFSLPFFLTSSYSQSDQAHEYSTEKIFYELKRLDSLLFNASFNTCDYETLYSLVLEDFEFYHDQGGITKTRKEFIDATKNGLCNLDYKARRELIEDTLEVFPLKQNGQIYGAIQNGEHMFYAKYEGENEIPTARAIFSHVWLLQNDTWKLSRVLSYDHQSIE